MARLKSAARNKLPSSSFGLPGSRKYPMPDKSHAADAKARASQAVKAGRMSAATEAKIDAKANRVLGKKRNQRNPRAGAKDGLGHGRGGMAVHPSAAGSGMDGDDAMHRGRY